MSQELPESEGHEHNPEEAEQKVYTGPIPRILHSFEHDGPFENCLVCHKDLLRDEEDYALHKTMQGDEVIMEYALCRHCVEQMNQEFSEASRRNLARLMDEHIDFEQRVKRFEQQDDTVAPFEDWVRDCALTGKKLGDCEQYTLMAICSGKELLYMGYPMMFSDEAEEMMNNVMSAETRRRKDDFVRDHFVPPELHLDPSPSPSAIVS